MRFIHRRTASLACLFLTLTPSVHANPIAAHFLWQRGLTVATLSAIIILGAETWMLRRWVGVSTWRSFSFVLLANVASAVPAYWIVPELYDFYEIHVARDWRTLYRTNTLFTIGVVLLFLSVSLVVELALVLLWKYLSLRIPLLKSWALRPLAIGVASANLLSYMLLLPFALLLDFSPRMEGLQWSDDTSFSIAPDERLLYFDEEARLCEVSLSGSDHRIIVPYSVAEFVANETFTHFLIRESAGMFGDVVFFDSKTDEPVSLEGIQGLSAASISNSGRYAAAALNAPDDEHGHLEPLPLVRIFDVLNQKIIADVPIPRPETRRYHQVRLLWSNHDEILFVAIYPGDVGKSRLFSIDLSSPRPQVPEPVRAFEPQTFATHWSPYQRMWSDYSTTADHPEGIVASHGDLSVSFGLGGDTPLRMFVNASKDWSGENEFLFLMPSSRFQINRHCRPVLSYDTRRPLTEAVFVADGREIVVGDGLNLYLINPEKRKIGLLVHGDNALVRDQNFERISERLESWSIDGFSFLIKAGKNIGSTGPDASSQTE